MKVYIVIFGTACVSYKNLGVFSSFKNAEEFVIERITPNASITEDWDRINENYWKDEGCPGDYYYIEEHILDATK